MKPTEWSRHDDKDYDVGMAAIAQFDALDARTFSGLPMPLTLRLPIPLSDLELMAFSNNVHPYQVERNAFGELEIMTPLGGKSGRWESRVIRELDAWAEVDGTGVTFSSSTAFRLSDGAILSPDASWLANERWWSLTPEQQEGFPPLAPDFVIEVLSKTDSRVKLTAKMLQWISNGVRLAWMIDPFHAVVTVYQASEQAVSVRPEYLSAEPVLSFRLETGGIWNTEA